MKQRVMVGMSGGVDSSAAAVLLKEQGYEVIGATLRLWPENAAQAEADARAVAETLGIRHYVFDFTQAFAREVVDYFTAEYRAGRTPNPCVMCNRRIKFGLMLQKADELGCKYIATGHYAGITQENGRFVLRQAAYAQKDQTYVLYHLTQQQLARTLMPLYGLSKDEVRTLAQAGGLSVADKPDSQDICFVPDGDYIGFLHRHGGLKEQPGVFKDVQGNVIGKHNGIAHFTIGQRKGLGMTFGKPMFVVDILAQENTVVLGEAGSEYASGLYAADLNWIAFNTLDAPMACRCKTRYRSREVPCTLFPEEDGRLRVAFDAPERAVTPGQSVVFYQDDMVLGGGVITQRT